MNTSQENIVEPLEGRGRGTASSAAAAGAGGDNAAFSCEEEADVPETPRPAEQVPQHRSMETRHQPLPLVEHEQQPLQPVSKLREAAPQVLATSAKNLLLLAYGMTLGFPTILIPALQRDSEPGLLLSSEQLSWLGSINLICVPLGCLGSGVLTTRLGRKRAMLFVNLPLLAAWVTLHLAASPAALLAALALTGLTGGLLEAPVLTYVAEITTPMMRGVLSSTSSMCVILGVNSQFILGTMLPWRTVAAINLAAPSLAFFALLLVPESPYWLATKRRLEEARSSLAWLRGWVPEAQVEREFAELVATVRAPQGEDDDSSGRETPKSLTMKQRLWATLKPYRRATFLKPFLLVSGAFFFGHFSGMTTLQTYAVSIFEQLGAPLDPYLATMVLGLVELGGTLICVIAVHWTGKRPLTLISTLGTAISFAVVASYDQLRIANHVAQDAAPWLPLVMLFFAAFLTHMGIRLLPWILIGEVFPPEVRGMASGLASSVGYIFGFLANKTHFSLVGALTLPGTFWVYVLVSAVATLVFFVLLLETEGRTLLEINMHFAGHKQPGWKRRLRNQPTSANADVIRTENGDLKAFNGATNGHGPKSKADGQFTDVRNNNALVYRGLHGSINGDPTMVLDTSRL